MSLLNKLDAIAIQPADKISEKDKQFIAKLTARYNKLTGQLFKVRDLLKEQEKLNAEVEKNWTLNEDHGWVSFDQHEDEEDRWGLRLYYTFKYPLRDIKKLIDNAYSYAKSDMIEYFNKAYNLKLEITDYNELLKHEDEVFNFDHCLQWVLSQTGGLSLTETGIKRLKDNFASEVNREYNEYRKIDYSPKLSKQTITIPEYMYYDGGCRLDYGGRASNRKYNILLKALWFFETGETDFRSESNLCPALPHEGSYESRTFNLGKAYELILDKVKFITFYGNGKVVVKFTTAELAAEFAVSFSINLAK